MIKGEIKESINDWKTVVYHKMSRQIWPNQQWTYKELKQFDLNDDKFNKEY